jgi:MFS transporter, PAT family, solute carrier family 33 (acetyl-CoA transportor), member 1
MHAVQETMAALVLFQFPCELLSAVVAGRWSASGSPFAPWRLGYTLRLTAGALMTTLVLVFPRNTADFWDHPPAFLAILAVGLLTSFSSTLMFTCMGTFFNRISDPVMGGAYLTMLNTIMNCGITLPQAAVFALVDTFSSNVCECASTPRGSLRLPYACHSSARASLRCMLLGPSAPSDSLRCMLLMQASGS